MDPVFKTPLQGYVLLRLLLYWSVTPAYVNAANGNIYMCTPKETLNSHIYCKGGEGSILETFLVEHRLYNDTKDMVDSPLKYDPDVVLKAWKLIDKKNKEDVITFRDKYFEEPGSELETCTPTDFIQRPKSIHGIKDPHYQQWALDLHQRWGTLCRKMKPSVREYPGRTSLINVPYPFIVPGGRFREFYYWDSYWIIKGLIVSEMYESARNIILNLASMVLRYGFVPNGGRVYYLQRSQPPLLIQMVDAYVEATNDVSVLEQKVDAGHPPLLQALKMEFQFWMQNRALQVTTRDGSKLTVYQYKATSNTPRPESYFADYATAHGQLQYLRSLIYQHIASSAESGWDFSSRFFGDGFNMTTIKTTRIVPVELNAYLCANARILAKMTKRLGDHSSLLYAKHHRRLMANMKSLFWNRQAKTWFDYDLDRNAHNTAFNPSSLIPLFAQCFDGENTEWDVYSWAKATGAFSYQNGLPTSFKHTEQQWDLPNGWPPLNHMAVYGLLNSNITEVREAAFQLAEKWVAVNYKVYNKTSFMFEKYDVEDPSCLAGHGGEYEVQVGFGWTNGVILEFLKLFGDRLQAPKDNCHPDERHRNEQIGA